MSEQPLQISDPALTTPEYELGVEQARRLVGALETQPVEASVPEQAVTSSEITAAFKKSQQIIDTIKLDEHFQAQLIKLDIHPYKDAYKQPYWNALANYVSSRLAAKQRDDPADKLQLGTLEILASTPAFLFAQTALDADIQTGSDGISNKVIASTFNGYIRGLADQFPAMTASQLRQQLLIATQSTMLHNAPATENATDHINKCIRGAQHEAAFGQLITATGLPFRASTVPEDLKGIDYVVDIGSNKLAVDVKASLHDISAKKSEGPYAINNGKVIMYSLIDDHELHDVFRVSDETASRKAPIAHHLLLQASQEIYSGKQFVAINSAV